MKPIIKWQTHTTEATAKVLGVELSVKSNGKGKFESTVYCSGMRPEKDHTFDTLDDGKAWCEQTLQRWINASFEPVSEPLADTLKWFELAVPEPTLKSQMVQIGCHFEEVAEMMVELGNRHESLEIDNLADYYKNLFTDSEHIEPLSLEKDIELLDSLCDQIVTALGVGYMFDFDMQKALAEVVRSNWSKFENGKPVFDDNGKIKKGANYTPPQLQEFI